MGARNAVVGVAKLEEEKVAVERDGQFWRCFRNVRGGELTH